MNATERVLSLIPSARPSGTDRWMGKCPGHVDKSPSLSIRRGHDRCLVHCHAGCTVEAICDALGIRVSDLFDDSRPYRPPASPEVQQQRAAWEGLEVWRKRRIRDCCDLIRGLEHLAFAYGEYLKVHEADLGNPGRLNPDDHEHAVEILAMVYRELPIFEREWELLTSPERSDHLTAWRTARRADAVPA